MIRRVFFDTNVLLDVLTARQPFFDEAAHLWSLAETRALDGYVSALSLPTVYYLLRRVVGSSKANTGLKAIRSVFTLVPLDQQLVDQALEGRFADFEDGIQACAALRANADCLVTRDPRGFKHSAVTVMTPQALIAILD